METCYHSLCNFLFISCKTVLLTGCISLPTHLCNPVWTKDYQFWIIRIVLWCNQCRFSATLFFSIHSARLWFILLVTTVFLPFTVAVNDSACLLHMNIILLEQRDIQCFQASKQFQIFGKAIHPQTSKYQACFKLFLNPLLGSNTTSHYRSTFSIASWKGVFKDFYVLKIMTKLQPRAMYNIVSSINKRQKNGNNSIP